jgi:hypothetical protein
MLSNVSNNNGSIVLNRASDNEINRGADFFDLFKNTPIPKEQLLNNLGLFINRQSLSRILIMNELYKKILNIHGIICEFGVYWG